MSHLRLPDAWLCVNDGCDTLHDSPRKCPVCGSEVQAFRVSRVIKPMPRDLPVEPVRPAEVELAT